MTHRLVPRISYDSNERQEMALNDADKNKVLRGRWTADVTDQKTGRRYRLRGASCGIPRCMCDAVIVCELAK